MFPPDLVTNKNTFFYYDIINTQKNHIPQMQNTHYHNYYEIYYLMQGRCNLLINDRTYELKVHDIVFLPPDTIHKMTYPDDIRIRAALTFTTDYIAPCFKNELSEIWQKNVFRAKEHTFIDDLFKKIEKESFNDNDISREMLKCYLTELLAYTVRSKKYLIEEQSQLSSLKHITDYIQENYSEDITLDLLANLSGYSTNYFSRLFKDVIGIGYKEYTVMVRLKVAEKLLKATNKSIKEIAISCGFNDSNYFSTVFQNKYGVPPTQYKKDQFTQFGDSKNISE